MDNGETKVFSGYRIQHNAVRVLIKEVEISSRCWSKWSQSPFIINDWKNALVNIPFGGARGEFKFLQVTYLNLSFIILPSDTLVLINSSAPTLISPHLIWELMLKLWHGWWMLMGQFMVTHQRLWQGNYLS